jgi:TM2 domain-containing membrane protein YozV
MQAAQSAYSGPSDAIAAALSLIIPGAGQIYKGRLWIGLLWLVCTGGGYLTVLVPGMFLHFLCVFHAYGTESVDRH